MLAIFSFCIFYSLIGLSGNASAEDYVAGMIIVKEYPRYNLKNGRYEGTPTTFKENIKISIKVKDTNKVYTTQTDSNGLFLIRTQGENEFLSEVIHKGEKIESIAGFGAGKGLSIHAYVTSVGDCIKDGKPWRQRSTAIILQDSQLYFVLKQLYSKYKGTITEKTYAMHSAYYLGRAFLKGDGAKKDIAKADKLLINAALIGHVGAKYTLGRLYNDGKEYPKNKAKAYMWYSLADEARGKKSSSLEKLEKEMTDAEIATGKRLISDYKQRFEK